MPHAPSLAPHSTSSHSLSGGLLIRAQVDLSANALCGIDVFGKGTYTLDGIEAIADALRGRASLIQALAFLSTSGPRVSLSSLTDRAVKLHLSVGVGGCVSQQAARPWPERQRHVHLRGQSRPSRDSLRVSASMYPEFRVTEGPRNRRKEGRRHIKNHFESTTSYAPKPELRRAIHLRVCRTEQPP